MTAPRRSARPTPPGRPPPRPSSITLALASLALAVALPIGALAAADRFDTMEAVLAATSGMVFLAVVVFLAAAKRRSGVPIGSGGVLLSALVSSALIVAAYAGIAYAFDTWRGPHDALSSDDLFTLAAIAAVTFIVIYSTLSMARR